MSAAATLGELVDALDVNVEALAVVAKRAPKVRPNGSLAAALDKMRETTEMLASCGTKPRKVKR